MAEKYLDCCLELDKIHPFVRMGQNGRKYLYFKVTSRANGPDQYGKTHNISLRAQNPQTGTYETVYIGSATEKEFQNNGGQYPQGGYASQQQRQGYAPQGGYAPQQQYRQPAPATAPAPQNYAPQNLPPQAPPPAYADAPAKQTEDLPFNS